MNETRLHILVGAVIGGIVVLLLLYLGHMTLYNVLVLPLPLLGAWLGWKSSPDARRPFDFKRLEAEDQTGYYRQRGAAVKAKTEVHKAAHGLKQVGRTIDREDTLETEAHRRKRMEHKVAMGELLGKREDQKTSGLGRVLQRLGLERRIAAARRPDLTELERTYVRGVDAVEDVMAWKYETTKEIYARNDLDEGSKASLAESVSEAAIAELQRRLDRTKGK